MSLVLRKYLAEVLGTLILVFVGGLSIVAAAAADVPNLIVVAFGFGLALLIGLYAFGEVSGGHFNPAVSLAMMLDGRMGLTEMIGYWVAQVAGALLGGLLLLFASDQATVATTATLPVAGVTETFLLELALTTFFVAVILKVTMSETYGGQALTAIPLALVGVHLAIWPLTGSSVNPARTLGSGIVGNELTDVWIYMVAPLVGAAIGWTLYRLTVTGTIEMRVRTE